MYIDEGTNKPFKNQIKLWREVNSLFFYFQSWSVFSTTASSVSKEQKIVSTWRWPSNQTSRSKTLLELSSLFKVDRIFSYFIFKLVIVYLYVCFSIFLSTKHLSDLAFWIFKKSVWLSICLSVYLSICLLHYTTDPIFLYIFLFF